jgi:cobaltochelatase CobN
MPFCAIRNPEARESMQARFAEAMQRGLWQPRRNSVAAMFDSNLVGNEAAE